jgi:hypothetical protein
MMPPSPQSVELAVDLPRNRRNGSPAPNLGMSESPGDPVKRDTGSNFGRFIHIRVVVIVDEAVAHRLSEDDKDHDHQQGADAGHFPTAPQGHPRQG